MPNDKRNRPTQAGDEDTDRDVQNELSREEAANSKEQDENPQRGESWSNYRTRELSSEEGSLENVSDNEEENEQGADSGNSGRESQTSGENFYRNRERGNYEEGQDLDDGGGGSLY